MSAAEAGSGGKEAAPVGPAADPRDPADEAVLTAMEIVATVSHELRSPLTSIKGFTELMIEQWDRLGDDDKLDMLAQVHHDADRVTRLVTELLDLSRIETGRLELRRRMVSLPSIAAGVIDRLRPAHPDLEVELAFPEPFPEVYADPDKIEQILTNLVENVTKYADPRGVRVTGEVLDGAVAVAVRDRGEGIPPDELPHVFDRFFHRDTGQPSGTGLGLWISRGLVEAHGGRIGAESEPGRGSTFRFTLALGTFERLHGTDLAAPADSEQGSRP